MHERRVTGFDRIRAVREVVRRQSLQHDGRRSLELDGGGHLHEPLRRHDGELRVRAEHHRIGHAIADGDFRDAGAHGRHRPRGLRAERERQLGRLVAPRAVLHVDEVDAGRRNLDERFAGLRRRHVDLVVTQRVGAAAFVYAYGFHRETISHVAAAPVYYSRGTSGIATSAWTPLRFATNPVSATTSRARRCRARCRSGKAIRSSRRTVSTPKRSTARRSRRRAPRAGAAGRTASVRRPCTSRFARSRRSSSAAPRSTKRPRRRINCAGGRCLSPRSRPTSSRASSRWAATAIRRSRRAPPCICTPPTRRWSTASSTTPTASS